jgi:magnesium chelatase family protein
LLDRIDIQLEVLPVPFSHLSQMHGEERSESMLERVEAARQMQQKRFAGIDKTLNNARMGNACRMRFANLIKLEAP